MSYRLRKLFFVMPCFAGGLNVGDFRPVVAEVADKPAEVRILLIGGAELLDDLPIVEAEAGEVPNQRHFRRHPGHHPVVETPDPRHQP